jgi:lipoprotein NlpI
LKSKGRPSAEVFVRRSTLYHTLGSYQAALEDAKQAVALSPMMPVAHFRVGITLYAMEQYEDAAQAFLDGLAGEPENKFLDNARIMALSKIQSRKRR